MGVAAVGDAASVCRRLGQIVQIVAVDDRHLIGGIEEHACGRQPRHTFAPHRRTVFDAPVHGIGLPGLLVARTVAVPEMAVGTAYQVDCGTRPAKVPVNMVPITVRAAVPAAPVLGVTPLLVGRPNQPMVARPAKPVTIPATVGQPPTSSRSRPPGNRSRPPVRTAY
jgi:hypothetical protein